MPGRVFVSCGQRGEEKQIAERVEQLLKRLGLEPYLAFKIQSFDDVMTITRELRSSDYFLFIDFKRNPVRSTDLPCSLFTHQELALAHHLGFQKIIALQETGAPLEGFLRYVLSNPESFSDADDLLKKLEVLVVEKSWHAAYSRNLIPSNVTYTPSLGYGDHTGSSRIRAWELQIQNRRPDSAAVSTVCVLEHVLHPDGTRSQPDTSYLKWSGQAGYERTILPEDFAVVDLFSIHAEEPGIFLLSLRDAHPRLPIAQVDGEYELHYKVYASGFPLLRFCVKVNLRWKPPDSDDPPSTRATLSSVH